MSYIRPLQVIAQYQCHYCSNVATAKVTSPVVWDSVSLLTDEIRGKGWLAVEGEPWCGTCDPRVLSEGTKVSIE